MNRFFICFFIACVNYLAQADKNNFSSYKIKKSVVTRQLYFGSNIQPKNKINVSSLLDGVISEILVPLGNKVEKGQTLFVMESENAEAKYQSSLSDFLKSKERYLESKTKLKDARELFDLGVISRNDFEKNVSALNHANLSYIKSLNTINRLTEESDVKAENITNLDIGNVTEVEKALKEKHNCVKILAAGEGILLLPESSSKGDGKILKGSKVSKGNPIAIIADLSSISLQISVTEVDVRDVKLGQAAIITGVAFPEFSIVGRVSYIDPQAKSNSFSSGVPMFNVNITVDNISKRALKMIKVGMSARVQLNITKNDAIEIPINAISTERGRHYVYKIENGKSVKTNVTTGRTSIRTVHVLDGLKEGDEIVIPNLS